MYLRTFETINHNATITYNKRNKKFLILTISPHSNFGKGMIIMIAMKWLAKERRNTTGVGVTYQWKDLEP